MPRSILIKSLTMDLFNISCAHECRYCLFGEKRPTKVAFSRFGRLVERMADWIHANQRPDFVICFLPGYSRNAEVESLREHMELNIRIGNGFPYHGLNLGGLRFRPPEARSAWLSGLRALGVNTLHASLAGSGAVHDRWNGRDGDFEYLMDLMRIGRELGIRSEQTFFILKSTFPLIDDLRELMELEFGGEAKYYVRTFNYMGSSKAFEDERITEETRELMPNWAKSGLKDRFTQWRSEREWVEFIMQAPEQVERVDLNLEINEANIDRLEGMSARAVFEELESKALRTYDTMPSLKDLCVQFGNSTNIRIYENKMCVDALWQDRAAAISAKSSFNSRRRSGDVYFNNFVVPEA